METTAGIKSTQNANGTNYVRVDLDIYGDNQLLEDFLDLTEIEASKKEADNYVPLEEFMEKEYKRRGLNRDNLSN